MRSLRNSLIMKIKIEKKFVFRVHAITALIPQRKKDTAFRERTEVCITAKVSSFNNFLSSK